MMFHPMKTIDDNWNKLRQEKSRDPDPIKISYAYNQRLTIFHNPLDPKGRGHFSFDIGKNTDRINVKLNIAWGQTGPGLTYTSNRLIEELSAYLRNQRDIKLLKATAYLPNTQQFQPWCQFVEVRQGWHNPIMCYVIWNGETIIPSVSSMIERESARDWTFAWKNAQSLTDMLTRLKGEI